MATSSQVTPRCKTKGCPFPALIGQEFCRNHTDKPDVLHNTPAAQAREFDVVPADTFPTHRLCVKDQQAFNVAKALIGTTPLQAIRVKGIEAKRRQGFRSTVTRYAEVLGKIKVESVTQGDTIFFRKKPAKN